MKSLISWTLWRYNTKARNNEKKKKKIVCTNKDGEGVGGRKTEEQHNIWTTYIVWLVINWKRNDRQKIVDSQS